jgi:transposase-like protein
MTKKQGQAFAAEFKREEVGLLASSSRTIRRIARNLNLGLSTLNRWKRKQRDAVPVTTPNPNGTKEQACLRKGNENLRQEWDILKR